MLVIGSGSSRWFDRWLVLRPIEAHHSVVHSPPEVDGQDTVCRANVLRKCQSRTLRLETVRDVRSRNGGYRDTVSRKLSY